MQLAFAELVHDLSDLAALLVAALKTLKLFLGVQIVGLHIRAGNVGRALLGRRSCLLLGGCRLHCTAVSIASSALTHHALGFGVCICVTSHLLHHAAITVAD